MNMHVLRWKPEIHLSIGVCVWFANYKRERKTEEVADDA